MVSVSLYQNGFSVSGHAGFGEYGKDVVCAAVTASVRLCEAVLDSAGILPDIEVDEKNAVISMTSKNERAAFVFKGFGSFMKQLALEYPNYITIEEDYANA